MIKHNKLLQDNEIQKQRTFRENFKLEARQNVELKHLRKSNEKMY